jgi:hypothetical protein
MARKEESDEEEEPSPEELEDERVIELLQMEEANQGYGVP